MSVYMTEEEQLESIKKWWLRHQSTITTIVTITLFVVAGYRYWNWNTEQKIQLASSAYENMMISSMKQDDISTQSYANQLIKNDENTIYAAAAHLTLAKVYVGQENYDKAEENLKVVARQSLKSPLKSIAAIRLARLFMAKQQYDKALSELSAVEQSPYTVVINELKGDIYSATGDYAKAAASYQTAIATNKSTGLSNHLLEMKSNAITAMLPLRQAAGTVSQVV